MFFSLHGVHVPHRKNTAMLAAIRMNTPETVTIPMTMHIGKPCIPVVKAGDHVYVGTLIGQMDGRISAPIYSSVSGTVAKIDTVLLSSGAHGEAVVIKSDGRMELDPSVKPPIVNTRAELIEAIRDAGTVGLGGAGFPSYVKFDIPEGTVIEELVINGAECEPYITSDTRTMIDKADDMAYGIQKILEFIDIKRVIIGIENNKKEAIAKMRETFAEDSRISVKVLPALYPQGGEKVLVYHLTGKVIPAGKLPLDVGCIVCNCTTVGAIGNYLKTGYPLVSKCITIDGSAVAEPKNVIAPIGASIGEVFEFAGGFKSAPAKVLMGGPMMGISIPELSLPVLKNTNALIAMDEHDALPKEETPCIRCAGCVSHCPLKLNPVAILNAYKARDAKELRRLRVDVCMECGCCSYTCPTGQRLVETNKLAKAFLREESMKGESRG